MKSFDWGLGLEIYVQFIKAIMPLRTQKVHHVPCKMWCEDLKDICICFVSFLPDWYKLVYGPYIDREEKLHPG